MAYLSHLLLTGLSAAIWVAVPAQAATYIFDFGPTLSGQFTTSDTLTGPGYAITSVAGTIMGELISGIVANPYSPDPGHYVVSTGTVQDMDPPGTTTLEYTFYNLLRRGDLLDENGLLFTTGSRVVDLFYFEDLFYADFSPLGQNEPLDEVPL